MAVIFVCGVHGVGKTTFCQKLAKELKVPHFPASELIQETPKLVIPDSVGNKRVKNIERNQAILLEAVRKKVEALNRIILDGHTTIIDQAGQYQILPENLFQRLGITEIVLLEGPANEIQRRLLLRDGVCPDVEFIREHQILEKKHAMHLADIMNVPFYNLNGCEGELYKIIEKFIKIN